MQIIGSTYVVLLTSRGDRDDVLAGMAAGADDYVTKPLNPFTLHTRLLAADRVTSLHAEVTGYRNALTAQARTDPLTGLHNRLKLSEDLAQLESRTERYGEGYSLALCDVDHFKSYNDLYGHPAGDAALSAVGAALARHARQSDGAYRYGGEEFVILLPHQPPAEAAAVMERVRRAVQELGIVHDGDPSGGLTISIGVADNGFGHRTDSARVLEDADAALYAAKAQGRNTVELAPAHMRNAAASPLRQVAPPACSSASEQDRTLLRRRRHPPPSQHRLHPQPTSTSTPVMPAPQGSPPLHITYSGVGMDQNVLPLTPPTQGQTSIVPPMTVEAYWLTPYGSPGSTDTTYIIGHSWEGRDTAFNHLSTRANPGDRITLTTKARPVTYTVKTVSTENKNTLKDSPIWNKVPNRLILISCYTADLWGTNIIITADQTPTP